MSAAVDWRHAHAVYAAVSGGAESVLLTAAPEAYIGTGVWAIDINKP
ncbi:hypothetical protein ACF1BU_20990 [Streptomyces sp. NPDC014724]